MKNRLYLILYKYIFPYLIPSSLSKYIKWKLAILLVGSEFHELNLVKNIKKLSVHFKEDSPLQNDLVELLDNHDYETPPQVLDIGAGPISKVGKTYMNKPIVLIPIDPQATKYRRILDNLKLIPPVYTEYGLGESLTDLFQENSFDLVHARNSIDHTYNPIYTIKECLKVLKSDHFFYLNHFYKEGECASYYGLHQWNFYTVGNKFCISDPDNNEIVVDDMISNLGEITELRKDINRLIIIIKKI
ncbi:MAG: class I SAM-dependent methyltransferase [Spirochaetaceae bacterium]